LRKQPIGYGQRIDIRPRLEERAGGVGEARARRGHARCLLVMGIARIDVAAELEQRLHCTEIAAADVRPQSALGRRRGP
jgi:hypothetical protein